MDQKELTKLALNLYKKEVEISDCVNKFDAALKVRTVVDKRTEGYYCGSCQKFSKTQQMPLRNDRAIYPNNSTEIWIVNSHYDGCCGWD